MRRILILGCVLAQALVLVLMAAGREYIVQFGETVYLRTAPLDPRDLLRGDFVRLDYAISTISVGQIRGGLQDKDKLKTKGRKVFVALSKNADGLASFAYATDVRPDTGLYIRGRLMRHWRFRNTASAVRVKYGIEQLFVEQGKGIAIEKRRGGRDALQIPLEVEVALSRSGTGVIKGHRWSRLGIRLEVLRMPRRPRNVPIDQLEGPLSPKLKVTLKNVSEQPFVLLDPGPHCGFDIVPVKWSQKEYVAADGTCRTTPLTDRDVIELAPQQTYSVEIDLSQPRWHVRDGDAIGEIGRLAQNGQFRIVYRAPEPAALNSLSKADHVWLGHLPTRAFNAFGRID
ncbi:MAG: GDYXXLXY domain-containing protein [bacterium]|nr:GDYXXLXY domain-containing protein [bacterium]